ncbi:CTP synthase [Methanobrevibacter gottschalkii]|uniref:CTP synthase n=2 Tax=Methanobrevibacter gottschalkii TaxID=190974 RepID=A0A3N5B3M8_9EURY|nr:MULTISPECIES: CTP synthase [Methanobrevibacter]MCQ2971541.1 CTP synthase [archaeon]OEC95732.1 CTP synthase [Methanobrevibacter sp. A27]RPF51897.1 CTP synthase [Methanobrevibacter gottschalkii DSM 11977]SEL31777.1 CTP synthase [Methanobrevibacter gottschalkii]
MERIFLTKYIIITGGVVSSIGKGITSASMGRILRSYGLNVSAIKIDPYLNWDSGTLNPYQHGEVFVTSDGMETDLDLGHYERFLDVELKGLANITTGKVYESVIAKEREGGYLGECVQVIPHITNRIKEMIRENSESADYDVVLVELGGTVGDIESQPFLEALRQLRNEEGRENVMFVHVTFIPYLDAAGEFKTKPTQHSTKELRSVGINPDVIVCRSQKPIDDGLRGKIAHFCDVDFEAVVNTPDADTIYEVPLVLEEHSIGELIVKRIGLNIKPDSSKLNEWREVVKSLKIKEPKVNIGIIGKYVELEDSYISIRESLLHAAASIGVKANIIYLSSDVEELDQDAMSELDGILIPGGFGERGFEGKLDAIEYAIENNVPLFGICLGMQSMVTQFARRNGFSGANSSEFDDDLKFPVIDMMEEQKKIKNMGGTMRLGSYGCKIIEGTKTYEAYGESDIEERHRHRYEFNNDYRDGLQEKGLIISGTSPDDFLVEIIELPNHPWAVGCQFHPEFKSRPNRPHPLFKAFLEAIHDYSKN